MSKQNLLLFIGSLLFLTSCGGWSDKNKAEYLKICEKKDLSSEFCECALEKSTANYSDFASAINDEVGMVKIHLDCMGKEVSKEEQLTGN
tara:strand:+ start:145 stop:414 length:270 start_codon:yes stop_codon:yes gene_type:complete